MRAALAFIPLLGAFVVIACSGSDGVVPSPTPLDGGSVVTPPPPPEDGGNTPIDDDAGGTSPDGSSPLKDGGGDAGSFITVPPGPKLPGNRNICPGTYKTTTPINGANTGFTVSGQDRDITVILPPASFTGPRPVFVGFHQSGGTGPSVISAAKLADFAARGFIVLAPSGKMNGTLWPYWDALRRATEESAPNKDLELFDTMISCFASHFEFDQSRIFVGGLSAGGIMTNRVLQARSSLVAGGIVGSGVFSLTTGTSPPPTNQFVIVSWGGDNDTFGRLNFAEEASLASRFYDALDSTVTQVACRGKNTHHGWLQDLNPWYIDMLLTHPKGSANAPVTPSPTAAQATCSMAAATMTPKPAITCGNTARAGCKAFCQIQADCVGENHTTGSTLSMELAGAGIDAAARDCGGCITKCQNDGVGAVNAQVLACFATAPAVCGEGLTGGMPFLDAINACCKDKTGSSICTDLCNSYGRSPFLNSAFLPSCVPFLQ